ncbi:MAG: hypothetical protein AB1806_12695 [Acidobacteriota bacterium]
MGTPSMIVRVLLLAAGLSLAVPVVVGQAGWEPAGRDPRAVVGRSTGDGTSDSRALPPDLPLPAVLDVPGGATALAEAAGLDPALPRARVMLASIRALYELPDGVDEHADARRERMHAYLDGLRPGPNAAPDLVPLPLSEVSWEKMLRSGRETPLLVRILRDRNAALLYYGLSALDGPTREWLESRPGLLRALRSDRRAALMAAFGRSLRVRDGRIQVPGGPAAEPFWAALVGERPDVPERFFLRLLDGDRGRVALFYDSLGHLEPGQLAFALSLPTRDPNRRQERFAALYHRAGRSLAGFDPGVRPFDRVAYDLAHLLLMSRVTPEGELGGPDSAALWNVALAGSGIPDDPRAALTGHDLTETLDAAGLAALVSIPDAAVRRLRAETWFFGQRVFGLTAETEYPDVLVALRAMAQYKALMLTLERMDVVRPGTYVLAVRQAERISAIRDPRRARIELAQFQGALGILERARFSRVLDAAQAEGLVRSLCAASREPPIREGSPIAIWIEDELLAAIRRRFGSQPAGLPDRPIEGLVLGAMSGLRSADAAGPTLQWEGLRYRVAPGAGELRRLLAIRARQGGPSLDAALSMNRAGAMILTIRSPADVPNVRGILTDVARMFEGTLPVDAMRPSGPPPPGSVLEEAVSQLTRRREPRAGDAMRAARPVLQAAEGQLAAVLLSIAYAPHLGYPDSPVLLAGDPSAHHDFGLDHPRTEARARLAWQVPREVRSPEAGWRLSGAALGLDVVLARLSLRRVASETLPQPPAYRETERAAFAEAAVLTNPYDADPRATARVAAAVRVGRERATAAVHEPGQLTDLASAIRADEWRTNLLPWMGAHEPSRVMDALSLGELAVLGGARDLAAGTLVASGWSLCAELRGVPLRVTPWTTLAGRKATGVVPSLVPDLAIGVAEALERLGVPPALGRGVLLMATLDLLDSLRTNHDDDWMTLIGQAQRVASGLVEDYVAGQTMWGALTPASDERSH